MNTQKIFKSRWSIIAVIVLVILIAIGSGYYYVSATPQYSLYQLGRAIKNHDSDSFYKYFDVDSVTDSVVSQVTKQLGEENVKEKPENDWETLGQQLAGGLLTLMTPAIKEGVRKNITSLIEGASEGGDNQAKTLLTQEFYSLKKIRDLKIKRDGKIATIEINVKEVKSPITIKMRQTPQRCWKIIEFAPEIWKEIFSQENTDKTIQENKLEDKKEAQPQTKKETPKTVAKEEITPQPPQPKPQPESPKCISKWECSNWSECSSLGKQTRTCADINKCGITIGKPSELQFCTPPVPKEIEGLASIRVSGGIWENWDADTEKDGPRVEIVYLNAEGDIISTDATEEMPISADVKVYAGNKSTAPKDKLVFSAHYSENQIILGNIYPKIRIPKEQIDVNPLTDYWCGAVEVTIYTPQQGLFSDKSDFIRLYED